MTPKIIFNIFLILIVFTKCKSKSEDAAVYKIAGKISQTLDADAIRPFKEWSCVSYNNLVQWTKLKYEKSYWLTYQKVGDTAILSIERPEYFQEDFKSNFSFDTTNFWRFTFYLNKGIIFRLAFINKSGNRISNDTSLNVISIFPTDNPFTILDSLTILKEKLKILSSNYYARFGNFVEFMPYKGHKLFYLPDSLKFYSKELNGIDSSVWKTSFQQADKITNNWVLTHFKDAKCQHSK